MNRFRTATSVAALCALSSLMWPVASASAAPLATSATASTLPCVHPTTRTTPKWHSVHEPAVTSADLQALPASETTRKVVRREVAPTLPSTVVTATYVHVISGSHRGERPHLGRAKVQRLINILNNGMAGGQSATSVPNRYRFQLKGIDYRHRDSWYHAYFFGPRDKKMKRALHQGGARTLNIYINGGGPRGEVVLGWSRFPWQYAATPRLDGISVNVAGLPGGRARGFNLGDTVIHETGHWLGLFHTFQGGCGGEGDLVSDTPAEADPSFECVVRDSCPAPGTDPVHNFMDYSPDACMYMFTAGQDRRMDAAWARWRQNG